MKLLNNCLTFPTWSLMKKHWQPYLNLTVYTNMKNTAAVFVFQDKTWEDLECSNSVYWAQNQLRIWNASRLFPYRVSLSSSSSCFLFNGFDSLAVFCDETMLAVIRIFFGPIIEGLIRTFWTAVVVGTVNRGENIPKLWITQDQKQMVKSIQQSWV